MNHNKDFFVWSALDIIEVSRIVIEHSLNTDASIGPKAEVHRMLEAKFVEPFNYPTWLANVVMIKKK
jgi:hypothetical protein